MTVPDPNLQWDATDVKQLEVVYEGNHEGLAVSRLPGVLRNQLHVRRLTMALARGAQRLEDDLWGVYEGTTLGLAQGDALDRWGALVGEPRGSLLEDNDYRAVIEARAFANHCDGTPDMLIALMERALAPTLCVEYFHLPPAGFQIQASRESWMSEERRGRVRAILADASPAGRVAVWVEGIDGGFGPPTSCVGNTFTGPLSRII